MTSLFHYLFGTNFVITIFERDLIHSNERISYLKRISVLLYSILQLLPVQKQYELEVEA